MSAVRALIARAEACGVRMHLDGVVVRLAAARAPDPALLFEIRHHRDAVWEKLAARASAMAASERALVASPVVPECHWSGVRLAALIAEGATPLPCPHGGLNWERPCGRMAWFSRSTMMQLRAAGLVPAGLPDAVKVKLG